MKSKKIVCMLLYAHRFSACKKLVEGHISSPLRYLFKLNVPGLSMLTDSLLILQRQVQLNPMRYCN